MIYVVSSFDFGGTSDVKLHAATADRAHAQKVYESVRSAYDLKNATTSSTRVLVELTPVPPDADELTLFWGGAPGAENNNK